MIQLIERFSIIMPVLTVASLGDQQSRSTLRRVYPSWKFAHGIVCSITACPCFSDTEKKKKVFKRSLENLNASLRPVLSLTRSLSFDLHLHKGSQNAKMLDHSTGVLSLHKLLRCPFVRLIPSCLSDSLPPTPTLHRHPRQALVLIIHSFHSSSQD